MVEKGMSKLRAPSRMPRKKQALIVWTICSFNGKFQVKFRKCWFFLHSTLNDNVKSLAFADIQKSN